MIEVNGQEDPKPEKTESTASSNLEQQIASLEALADTVANMTLNVEEIMDQPLDTEARKMYQERFNLFVKDGCPAAITAYMDKANRDDSLNTATKIHIMADATKALEGATFEVGE